MKLFNKLSKNRRASAYWFIYTLLFAFALGVLYIIFNQILNVNLYPISSDMTGGNTVTQDKWIGFWNFTPWILVLLILVFIFVKFTQPETTEIG